MLFHVPEYYDNKTVLLENLAEKLKPCKVAVVAEYNRLIGFNLLCFDLSDTFYDVDGGCVNWPGAKERIMYRDADAGKKFSINLVNKAIVNLIRNKSKK